MKKLLNTLGTIFFVSLFIHLAWEVIQSPLYNCIELPVIEYIQKILTATFGDGIITLFIYGVLAVKNRKTNWFFKYKKSDYYVLAFLGIAIGIAIEVINVNLLQRWDYTSLMPSLFGIGIVPILQMMILPFFIFWISKRLLWRPKDGR